MYCFRYSRTRGSVSCRATLSAKPPFFNAYAVFSSRVLLLTRFRVFPCLAHKRKNGESLRPRQAGTILGGNYLIAQQLPASSPKADPIMLHYIPKECKYFFEKRSRVFSSLIQFPIQCFQCFSSYMPAHASRCFIFAVDFAFQAQPASRPHRRFSDRNTEGITKAPKSAFREFRGIPPFIVYFSS